MKESIKNGKLGFCIRKLLAFTMIYMVSAVGLESIIIGIYLILGYDVLNGRMPEGELVARIPFCGMAGFALVTILYVKFVEKRKLSEMGIVWNRQLFYSILKGMVIGVAMVSLMLGIFLLTGLGTYQGRGGISISSMILWMLAYLIQSFTEELMCRGFLQTSLSRRVNQKIAILLTSLAFMAPHLSGLMELDGAIKIVSIINLLLVSILFSVIMIKENSLGASCGLHFGWNFCLGVLLGLEVSGGSTVNGVIHILVNPDHTIMTGGIYGIEASILLIPVLVSSILVCIFGIRRRRAYGVQ